MSQKRLIDKKIKSTQGWMKNALVLINKKEIRTWQGVFVIAFCAGIFATVAWAISSGIHPFSSAASNVPNNQCAAIPAGGTFDGITNVRIKCGRYVGSATYNWEGETPQSFDLKKGIKLQYNAHVREQLYLNGYASASGTPIMARLQKQFANRDKYQQKINEMEVKISNTTNSRKISRYQRILKKYQNRLNIYEARVADLEARINSINKNFSVTYKFYPSGKCVDSDGGYNNNIRGTVTINKNYGYGYGYGYNIGGYGYDAYGYGSNSDYYTDKCNRGKTKVIEYYCNSRGYASKKTMNCVNGCSNGACLIK